MEDRPLYQDERLRIDYLPRSPEDHILLIKESGGEEFTYVIQRGILEELARTQRGGIERKIATFNDSILYQLQENSISVDELHIALCQAYAEEERRIRDFIRTQDDAGSPSVRCEH